MRNMKSEYKQPFFSTNDGKNERFPVVFYSVHQHHQERDVLAEEWKARADRKDFSIRCFERHIKVDTVELSVFVLIVRRRAEVLS